MRSEPAPLDIGVDGALGVERALERGRAAGTGCAGFATLGPLAQERAALQRGETPPTNPCAESAKRVVCLESEVGHFVPVSVGLAECTWHPWFVPKDPGAAIVASAEGNYSELDLAFTVGIHLDALPGRGAEILVVRGFEHPEGVASGTSVVRHLFDGTVRSTPFDLVRDHDGDGLFDGVLVHETQEDAVCLLHHDVWARIDHRAPELLAHRLADGSFTLLDDVARAARREGCRGATRPIVARDRTGRIDDAATARNVVCAAAEGNWDALEAELSSRCTGEPRIEDCPKRAKNACFVGTLHRWLERIGTVGSAP